MTDDYEGPFESFEEACRKADEKYGRGPIGPEPPPYTNGKGHEPQPLPFIDMSTWDANAAPQRPWLIEDYIPMRQPTLISGPGGVGKSILLLQLLAATALIQPWIGKLQTYPGPVIYLGAEDEVDEIRRRLEPILDHHKKRFADLIAGGFKALAYAGEDAVLGEFDRTSGRIKPTQLFAQLYETAHTLQPAAVVVDALSDVFLGDEIKREQVRQFGSLMRKLAMNCNTAVILASHPSVLGMKSGSGMSGSTQWHNTVRARAYFQIPTSGDDEEMEATPDTGERELEFMKNQYGPLGRSLPLRWTNGLWLPPPVEAQNSQVNVQAEELFMTLLRRFIIQGRDVSSEKSPTYAPAKFAALDEAKKAKITGSIFARAMERLLQAGRIKVVVTGSPARQRKRLDVVTQ